MAKKIMIVDDALFMRMMIRNILTKNGYDVIAEAENGATAVEKYKNTNPDLVIMDITMPEVNGIEAVRMIRKINKNAKIIMCSAIGKREMVFESLQAGARDFILKPFQAERVLDAVKKATSY